MKINYEVKELIRLDKFLDQNLPEVSRSKIQDLIKGGQIQVDGKLISKPNFQLQGKGLISLTLEPSSETIEIKEWDRIDLIDIIFENDDYMVLNKPKKLVVHPGTSNQDQTLVNILKKMNVKLANEFTERPGIIHRLDKDTTGIIVVSKNDSFLSHLQNQFMEKKVTKNYLGLVIGNYKNSHGMIDAPIGRSQKNRTLMEVVSRNGKDSQTIFKVKERFVGFDLMEFSLLTGRTHQIRVHSKYVGNPIYNDPAYSKEKEEGIGQYLHAYSITFLDLKGKEVTYTAPIPDYFNEKLNTLRGYNNKDV